MMLRIILLSLALLVSMGGILSLTTDYSEAGPKKSYHKKKKKKKLKKYSRAWWKWYKAKKSRQKALSLRRKMLKLRQAKLANRTKAATTTPLIASTPEILSDGEPLPRGWKLSNSSSSEMTYIVGDEFGSTLGTVAFALVGFAKPDNDWRRNKTLAGVELSVLRRIVIDRMMREQGWVVNDYQKEINGRKVFVVVAQVQQTSGNVRTRLFYFTEVDGKIYSLATNSSPEATDAIAEATEKVLANFRRPERAGLK